MAHRSAFAFVFLITSGLALVGCQSPPQRGMMEASWTSPDGAVALVPFTFESVTNKNGGLFTTLGDGGEHYSGPYVLIEASTQGELVTEVWNGVSSPEWEAWQHSADGAWHTTAISFGAFADFYTGKAVASMSGNRGDRMRCQLHLDQPEQGPLAGGTGLCQTTVGDRVDLSFPGR